MRICRRAADQSVREGYCNQLSHFDNQFLTYTVTLQEWFTHPGYGSLFLLSFLASTLVPIGSEWLLVLMLAKGYPAMAAVLTATAGNCLGAATTYLIGVYGGSWLIERLLRITPEQQERAHRYYLRYGVYSLFFSWLPIIGDPLCLAGGMMRIDFRLFALLVSTGKLVRYAVTAWITVQTLG